MNKQIHLDTEKLFFFSTIFIIFLGLVFRIRFYLIGRSLWLDEAMLALNILNRSFAGLFQQPMEYGQSSPIGYVTSVKLFTLILGDSEYALRFYSLIAGCMALILMSVISRNILGKTGSLITIAIFAFNPELIYYTSETKQYISDVIATLLLLFLFHRQITVQATKKDFAILGIAGTIILWFSHPIVFVVAAVGITLLLHYWETNDLARMLATLLCGLAWGVSLIILYIVNLRHLASSDFLLNYWQEGFMEVNLRWFADIWQAFLETPFSTNENSLLIFIIFVIGMVYLIREYREIGITILLTLTFALIASGLHKYSLLGRMLLFVVPLIAIAIGLGIERVGLMIKDQYLPLVIQVLFAVYLMWAPFGIALGEFAHPKYREHIKPSLQYLRDYKKDNDLIYVYYNTGPAFRFYAPKFGLETSNYIIGSDHSPNPEAYQDELETLVGNKRVWLIFSHIYEDGGFNEKDFIVAYADQIGEKIREFHVSSTSIYLYLYDFQ